MSAIGGIVTQNHSNHLASSQDIKMKANACLSSKIKIISALALMFFALALSSIPSAEAAGAAYSACFAPCTAYRYSYCHDTFMRACKVCALICAPWLLIPA